MDKLVGIEINHYGIEIDSAWTYLALSWQLLLTSAIIFGIVRVVKLRKNKKVVA